MYYSSSDEEKKRVTSSGIVVSLVCPFICTAAASEKAIKMDFIFMWCLN